MLRTSQWSSSLPYFVKQDYFEDRFCTSPRSNQLEETECGKTSDYFSSGRSSLLFQFRTFGLLSSSLRFIAALNRARWLFVPCKNKEVHEVRYIEETPIRATSNTKLSYVTVSPLSTTRPSNTHCFKLLHTTLQRLSLAINRSLNFTM